MTRWGVSREARTGSSGGEDNHDDNSHSVQRTRFLALVLCSVLTGVLLAGIALPWVGGLAIGAKASTEAFLNLPSDISRANVPLASYLYASDGSVIATFYDENRVPVPLSSIPTVMRQAVLAAEDARFYEHGGVDPVGIVRALVANQKSGEVTQGASTIAQQYVRNILLYSAENETARQKATEETVGRKLREARLALAIEQELNKDEILEGYLNTVFFGNNGYGVYAASGRFFNKTPDKLSLAEAALLAGLVRSPSSYNPFKANKKPAQDRRDWVLQRMADLKFITQAQATKAKKEPIKLTPNNPGGSCVNGNPVYGYFCGWFLEWWKSNPAFGATRNEREFNLKHGGYRITASIDPGMQDAAQKAVDKQVPRTSNFATGVVLMEPGTGRVKAMAINRTYSLKDNPGKRDAPNTVNPLLTGTDVSPGYQAGSTFKMFTMVAALNAGIPLNTRIYAPGQLVTQWPNPKGCGGRWCPKNATPRMTGTHTMWSGFGESVNTFFVQLESRATIKATVNMAEKLGVNFRSSSDRRLYDYVQQHPNGGWGSFTLGTADVTPLDMATAYSTVAARGKKCEPLPVTKLLDRNGKPVAAGNPSCEQVIPVGVADAANNAARCPVGGKALGACSAANGATAQRVGAAIKRPIAGKTGTTDGNKSAWFIGYTPNLSGAVFYADPDNPLVSSVPNTRVPVSVFIDAMSVALQKVPVKDFVRPPDSLIYGKSGKPSAKPAKKVTAKPRR
jgi:membrane peptidoglycan carboxypeptidase